MWSLIKAFLYKYVYLQSSFGLQSHFPNLKNKVQLYQNIKHYWPSEDRQYSTTVMSFDVIQLVAQSGQAVQYHCDLFWCDAIRVDFSAGFP